MSWPNVRLWPRAAPSLKRRNEDKKLMDLLLSILLIVAKSLALLLIGLTAVAYYIYADRKIWASVQLRRGPNVVGAWGLLQSFADMLKFCLLYTSDAADEAD